MIRVILILILCGCVTADAQLLMGVTRATSGGGTPVAPTCTNSLDFSADCNSQYLAIFKGLI